MGYGLAMSAYDVARDKKLGNAGTRLLVWMALNADDRKSPPLYFGGAGHRAAALTEGMSERAVRKVLSELKTAGVLVERSPAHRGRNAVYELGLRPTERRNQEFPLSERKAEPDVPKGGTTRSAQEEPHVPPYREREVIGGNPSPYCVKHPLGTEEPCRPCGEARKRADAIAAQRPAATFMRTVQPGVHCAPGTHRTVADGTCINCDIRAEEVA